MMKKIFLFSTLLALMLISCGRDTSNPSPQPTPTPSPQPTPEAPWNKDRTFEVLVLSNSTSASLATSNDEYEVLAGKINGLPSDSYSMIIAEQTNMEKGTNPALAFPLPLKQFGYFNLHSYSNGIADASLVVSKTWIAETHQVPLSGTAYLLHFGVTLKGTSPKALSFPLHICTFRVSSAEELAGFSRALGALTDIRNPHLFFGSIANQQWDAFAKTCSTAGDYVLTKVDNVSISGYTYAFYAPKSFKLREVNERFKKGNVSCMGLAIETGVK